MPKGKKSREEVLTHLHCMHVWADYAYTHGMSLSAKEIADIAKWTTEIDVYMAQEYKEPMEPERVATEDDSILVCGACRHLILPEYFFCPGCGTEVLRYGRKKN